LTGGGFISSFEDYFGESADSKSIADKDFFNQLTRSEIAQTAERDFTHNILQNNDAGIPWPEMENTYSIKKIFEGKDHFFTADANIDDIDIMAAELGEIMDTIMGVGWGRFTADFITPAGMAEASGNPPEVMLPQIVYDYTSRIINIHVPKPTLFNVIEEVVGGKKTGDVFRVFRQWFDYDMIFDIFHKDMIKARGLMKVFEGIVESSKARLKKSGVQQIKFAGEIDPLNARRYQDIIPQMASRCIVYQVTLERVILERASTLRAINTVTNQ